MSNNKSLNNDLIDLFARTVERSNTRRAYVADLRNVSNCNTVSLSNLRSHFSPKVIEAHFKDISPQLAASTIRRRRASLRVFLKWVATEFGRDLTAALDALNDASVGFAYDSDTKRVLNDADVTAILEATNHAGKAKIRDHSLIFVLYRCALRRSALASLNVENIETRGSKTCLAIRTKRAKYNVRISSGVLNVITNLTRHYRINSGPLWRSFSNNSRGKRLTPTSIYRIVQKTASRAGLGDNVTPDDLRLAGQVRLLKAGPSIQKVRSHSQHNSFDTTMIYARQRNRLAQSAADYIDLGDDKKTD